ncbi:MAG: sigma-70 family RNA polymerase sigma factor [Terracidiphilus sp.]|jgi:RNA polymerase sigma-70 factor (ECF subfamily)
MNFPEGPQVPLLWTDKELVVAAQNGNSSAWEELLTRHRAMVYQTARRYAMNAEDAEDLVQEAMLRAFVNIGTFRGEARFSSWLVAIVINAALSSKRKSKHFHWLYLDEIQESEVRKETWVVPDSRPNPEQECVRRELRLIIRRAISRQNRKYRFIVQACDLDYFSISETAQALGITYTAVKSRLHRARRELASALQKSGAIHKSLETGRHRY